MRLRTGLLTAILTFWLWTDLSAQTLEAGASLGLSTCEGEAAIICRGRLLLTGGPYASVSFVDDVIEVGGRMVWLERSAPARFILEGEAVAHLPPRSPVRVLVGAGLGYYREDRPPPRYAPAVRPTWVLGGSALLPHRFRVRLGWRFHTFDDLLAVNEVFVALGYRFER